MKNFMGKDGFQWFVGVVENRADPKTLGRVKVRCLGYHTDDLTKLPTADLPWAHVMNPITSATVSGIGQSPLGMVEGSWVIGFFIDGPDAQSPCIIGTLPGIPSELPREGARNEYIKSKGFSDPLGNFPRYTETDVNRLAVNDEDNPHGSLTSRKGSRDLAVGTAQIDGIFSGVAPIDTDLDINNGGQWNEPEIPYGSIYPYNHVYESESGHLKEFDDTKGKERIHERHTSGTGYEIDNAGTRVQRIVSDSYTIISNDDYTHIKGTSRQTIDEGLRIRVNSAGTSGNNYNIEVGQGSNVNVEVNGGNINLTTLGSGQDAGDININAARNMNMQIGGNMNIEVIGSSTETSAVKTQSTSGTHQQNAALHDINGNRIDLN